MSSQIFSIVDESIAKHGKVKTIAFLSRKVKSLSAPKTFSELTFKRSLKSGIMYAITTKR